jgi:hypothetical protein
MRAFRPKALAEFGPWGETKIYEFIKRGLLPARKVDGTTFVNEADWNAFLRNSNNPGHTRKGNLSPFDEAFLRVPRGRWFKFLVAKVESVLRARVVRSICSSSTQGA